MVSGKSAENIVAFLKAREESTGTQAILSHSLAYRLIRLEVEKFMRGDMNGNGEEH